MKELLIFTAIVGLVGLLVIAFLMWISETEEEYKARIAKKIDAIRDEQNDDSWHI